MGDNLAFITPTAIRFNAARTVSMHEPPALSHSMDIRMWHNSHRQRRNQHHRWPASPNAFSVLLVPGPDRQQGELYTTWATRMGPWSWSNRGLQQNLCNMLRYHCGFFSDSALLHSDRTVSMGSKRSTGRCSDPRSSHRVLLQSSDLQMCTGVVSAGFLLLLKSFHHRCWL